MPTLNNLKNTPKASSVAGASIVNSQTTEMQRPVSPTHNTQTTFLQRIGATAAMPGMTNTHNTTSGLNLVKKVRPEIVFSNHGNDRAHPSLSVENYEGVKGKYHEVTLKDFTLEQLNEIIRLSGNSDLKLDDQGKLYYKGEEIDKGLCVIKEMSKDKHCIVFRQHTEKSYHLNKSVHIDINGTAVAMALKHTMAKNTITEEKHGQDTSTTKIGEFRAKIFNENVIEEQDINDLCESRHIKENPIIVYNEQDLSQVKQIRINSTQTGLTIVLKNGQKIHVTEEFKELFDALKKEATMLAKQSQNPKVRNAAAKLEQLLDYANANFKISDTNNA